MHRIAALCMLAAHALSAAPAPGYAGAAACAKCHPEAQKKWAGSRHSRMVQPATVAAVQGDFNRGTVRLRSSNPKDSALFVANSLSREADVDTLVRGVELAIRISEAPSLAKLVKRRVLPKPGLEKDKDALRDYVRTIAKTVFHPSGTAKMGAPDDPMAVVSEDLKVRGIEHLRVADASVMPRLVSGNTNAPVMMIGERCSRFILGREKAA